MIIERRSVLDYFTQSVAHPVSLGELGDQLRLDRHERARLQTVLKLLTESGEIVRIKGGRFGLPRKLNLVAGQLRCSPKGFGFVVPVRGHSPDVFVRLPNMGGALHGDDVVARIEHRKPDGRLEGSIIRVLTRANQRLIGRFEQGPVYGFVVPMEPKIMTDVIIAPDALAGAEEGQIVEVEVLEFPGKTREATGKIVALVGWPDDPAVDLELVLRRNQLPRVFPADVQRAARAVASEVQRSEASRRTDFRDHPVVTIDGEKARDFDDAVSVVDRGSRGFTLEVHIADVSHYVAVGSELDEEARERSTSVYFPDHVIPMLPEELSNGICSLNPDVDRLTLSIVAEIAADGAVVDYRFHEGIIRSQARMTYDDVHRILVDRDEALRERYRKLLPGFEAMQALAAVLGRRRRERGSLDFDLPESEILLNVEGAMTGIRRGRRLVSHGIIEEFMILANEIVAEHFVRLDWPFLYRCHEPPDPGDVEELNASLSFFHYQVEALSPKSFREMLERVKGKPEERFVNTVVLRTMRLARYQPANIGHFGLASTAYSHFTSPIRRYPDLIVHRLVRESMHSRELGGKRREALRTEVDVAGADCSRLERRAEDAEREYIERKKARFMADKVGETFSGVITAVQAFGFFVELEEYFVEGLVHLTSLSDDYYQFDETKHRLLGESTGRSFRLGDPVVVRVAHVDLLRRKIDFVIEESAATAATAATATAAAAPAARPAKPARERTTARRRRKS